MRITPDTSVLVRGNTNARGPARELLSAVERTGSLLVVSSFILAEVERVLKYPRMQDLYRLSEDEIRRYLLLIDSLSDVVSTVTGPRVVPNDPDDDPIVYAALVGEADVICTTDRHLYQPAVLNFCARYRIRIMNDIDLLAWLRRSLI